MKTILVSGASGIVGYGCLKSLRAGEEKYRLIGAAAYDDSVAPKFCDVFERAPMTTESGYIDWLLNIIDKHHIDFIIPGIEIDMYTWSENISAIREAGCKALLNNPKLIALCKDKWGFYQALTKKEPALAISSSVEGDYQSLVGAFGTPFLLKPRRGYASRGIVRVAGKEPFLRHQEAFGETLMAQPIVGNDDEEYTTSAFFDETSVLCTYMTLRRRLSSEGFTEKAQTAEPDGIENALIRLAEIFNPVGPTNFQFRIDGNALKLLEINPRISSATSIRTAFGYNESLISARYFLEGIQPAQPDIRHGAAIRYTEDYIIYDGNHI